MRIGIETYGLDSLGLEKCYSLIAQAGFTGIDWDIETDCSLRKAEQEKPSIFEKPIEQVIAHYAEEIGLIRKYGLKISQIHAPFPPFPNAAPEVMAYATKIYQRMIELCAYVDCPILVIHGICMVPDGTVQDVAKVEEQNIAMYASLIPTLLNHSVTICLENLYGRDEDRTQILEGSCSDPHEAVRLIDTLNEMAGREVFGLCLDTGHLKLLNKDMRTYVPVLGKRIKAVHINDNYGTTDCHIAPMAGTTNWNHFCDSLRQIGYDGDLDFESAGQIALAMRYGEDMVLPWLELMRKTGESFRARIQG